MKKRTTQLRFDSRIMEKLEATKYWKVALKNTDRFDEEEKQFFLNKIRLHFSLNERMVARYYAELINVMSSFYNPAIKAKETRLSFLINEVHTKKSISENKKAAKKK